MPRCTLVHSGRDMETTKVPFDRGLDTEDAAHKLYYSAVGRDERLPLATTWMDLENTMLSEISQPEKGKNHMILLIHGI